MMDMNWNNTWNALDKLNESGSREERMLQQYADNQLKTDILRPMFEQVKGPSYLNTVISLNGDDKSCTASLSVNASGPSYGFDNDLELTTEEAQAYINRERALLSMTKTFEEKGWTVRIKKDVYERRYLDIDDPGVRYRTMRFSDVRISKTFTSADMQR